MKKELSEDLVATSVDYSPDAIFLVNPQGRIRHVSPACEDIFGYAPGDFVDQFIIDFVVPADQDATLREAKEVLAGRKRVGFENRYRHKDGSDVYVSWSARWLEHEQLRVGVARDVTEFHRRKAMPATLLAVLAPYERKVLDLLLTEATEKQIAEQLGLAVSTTHSYITGIFRKYGVRGRAGLMSLWLKHLSGDIAGIGNK
ncbi:LuxR family transcriptional regulator [Burkholderia sp. SRS-W-2-2016]|uniref:helix-turn-helix transcriptional regulator n=1 Tax=Burkholderia sp. SRS-W-2-2016 TaxID=1926878 RepID=UPI00094AD7C8|nr:PAS domain S-box protein [Burkholderia sp. SRS-W-2-2016]OLL31168.1 LuxR family transcriptional regulator [Burkholderia sp. SRS-W-2-2016]